MAQYGRFLALIILLLGLGLTALAWRYTNQVIEHDRELVFNTQVLHAQETLTRRIQSLSEVLYGIRGFVDQQPDLSRADFRRYVAANGFLDRLPGVQVAGLARVVTTDTKAHYEESVRADISVDPVGYPRFFISPQGDRAEYFPITYIEPMFGNEKAFGFDFASEPNRKLAVEIARDSGQISATGGITLVQETGSQTGLLLMAPFYRSGMTIQSPEQRRLAFLGVTYFALRMGDLIQQTFNDRFLDQMDLIIYDNPQSGVTAGKPVLFDSNESANKAGQPSSVNKRHHREVMLDVGGHTWRLAFTDKHSLSTFDVYMPWVVLLSGGLVSLLLAWVFFMLSTANRRAFQLKDQISAQLLDSEARSQAVLENVIDGIITISEKGIVESLNRSAEKIFGYLAVEVIGQNVKMLMPEPFHGEHDSYLSNYVTTGQRKIIGIGREVIGRRKDGSTFPMDLAVSEMRIEGRRIFTGAVRDITQRKAAAEAMAKVSGLNQTILDNADHSIIATNTDGLILIFNHAAERMLGYQADEMVDKQTPAAFHDLDEVVRRAQELTAAGVAVEPGFEVFVALSRQGVADTNEWSYIRKDGTRFPVSLTVTALNDEQGNITGFLGIATDITERKRSEKELHKLFRAVEQSPVSVVITNEKGEIEYVNAKFSEISGYQFDEAFGKNPSFMQSGQTPVEVYQEMWKVILAGAEWRGRLQNRKKNGELYWEYAYISAIRDKDGVITHFVAVKEDITERIRMEEVLVTVSHRNELILEAVDEGIYGVDTEGVTTFINPAGSRILGFEVSELVGQLLHPLIHHSHNDGSPYPASECKIYDSYRSGKSNHVLDEVFWRKDGSSFPVEYTSTPIVETGQVVGAVVSFRDITERQKMDRMKSEFISTVSHELRTPLTSIRGSLGLIAGGVVGELPAKAKALVDIAHKNSERLILLVNDILDMEKIASGKLEFHLKPVELMPLLHQALESFRAYGEQFNVGYELENELPDVKLNVDANRFIQVLANLLSNAAKFSPAGDKVQVDVISDGQRVRLAVKDHGSGIPAQFHHRIFQKFAQADSSDTRKKGGTGLGLSITKAIVEQMGGSIGFNSEPDVLTTFFVEFPVWNEAVFAVPSLRADRRRVLICEDDRDIAALIVLMLEQNGMEADIAFDAAQAKQMLAQGEYAALTLDLGLPDQDGISLIRELRKTDGTASLPIVVVSARAIEGQSEIEGEALSVVEWINKPINQIQLIQVLKQLVGQVDGRPTLLHVEDDPDIFQVVKSIVGNVADMDHAASLAEARQLIGQRHYDLVILDLGLPDGSGKDILPLLNEATPPIPVLVFSASEMGLENVAEVDVALVKARTSNELLLATIKKLVGEV